MRVEAGHVGHTSTDGTFINVDQRLSREQVDLLLQAIRVNGRCPSCVFAVDISEAGAHIEYPGGFGPEYRSSNCGHA